MGRMQKTGVHILGVMFIVAFFMSFLGFRNVSVGISAMENGAPGLCITDPSGFVHEIIYKDISDIRLITLPEDYGQCLQGGCRKGFRYGTWENSDYGCYSLCVRDSVIQAICLSQKEKIFIFNFEGKTSTENLYKALLEKIQESGPNSQTSG
ncbi:MAG: hypothetical protein LIP16_21845 [Clostridium sp.]|nr:hypothetical protein [Clostridium sp.]